LMSAMLVIALWKSGGNRNRIPVGGVILFVIALWKSGGNRNIN